MRNGTDLIPGAAGLRRQFTLRSQKKASAAQLRDGSRVGVIGGGPAGSLFSYFLIDMAERAGLDIHVDIYESRDFSACGPKGCNMCGGVVSESLVQALALEGINLPANVVRRGIDSYVLHMDEGNVRIEIPIQEKRIAVVYRGGGPKGAQASGWRSFDQHLLDLAAGKGANVIRSRVKSVRRNSGRLEVSVDARQGQCYDLLAVAVGVNVAAVSKLFSDEDGGYKPPATTRTYIREFHLGREAIEQQMGSAIHVFLLNLPRLKFAALIPKGDYVTLCMLGKEIDASVADAFMDCPEVKSCLPGDCRDSNGLCQCRPRINVKSAARPFADRVVFIGDCGTSRLYKDGIGAAYRTAKAAAMTAVFEGVSADALRRRYRRVCRSLEADNAVGKLLFAGTAVIPKIGCLRRGVLRRVSKEQGKDFASRRLSMMLWDIFTGSAPYRDVLFRGFNVPFLGAFLGDIASSMVVRGKR